MSKKVALKEYTPKVKVLESSFADMKPGQSMAIGTPQLIADLVKTVPPKESCSLSDLRKKLAKKLKAEVACPVTTSMYLRVAVEAEVEKSHTKLSFPFWRVIEIGSPIFKKLSPKAQEIIRKNRSKEGLGTTHSGLG